MEKNQPSKSHEPSDLSGPDSATLQVYLANKSAFLGFLRRRVPSDAIAEDLLQQGLLKAIRNDNLSDPKENVVAWFYRILRNVLTDYYRNQAAESRKNEGFVSDLHFLGEDHVPALDEETKTEICACLKGILPSLKAEYGEILQRIDLESEAVSDVAESLGITPNNLMVRLHRARQALKVGLERTCGICTQHGCLDCFCKTSHG